MGITQYVDEMTEGAVANPNYDHIIAGKRLLRDLDMVAHHGYVATFLIFARLFRRWSLLEDELKLDLHLQPPQRAVLGVLRGV